MKKAILAILLAGLIMAVYAQNGVVKELSGTVELKPAGAASFVPAAAGAQVRADTVISTGFKSTALLEVGSAIITVRPLTRLTLTEISASQGAETINMSLQAGRVRVDVNPPAGAKASLSVSSPSATASVRGTSFYFDTMNVSVREGTVAFNGNTGYTVQVGAGSFSAVNSYSAAGGAQSSSSTGLVPSSPTGYAQATGTASGTGGGSSPSSPSTPDGNKGGGNTPGGNTPGGISPGGSTPGGNIPGGTQGGGNQGGGGSTPSTGGVNIPITYK